MSWTDCLAAEGGELQLTPQDCSPDRIAKQMAYVPMPPRMDEFVPIMRRTNGGYAPVSQRDCRGDEVGPA